MSSILLTNRSVASPTPTDKLGLEKNNDTFIFIIQYIFCWKNIPQNWWKCKTNKRHKSSWKKKPHFDMSTSPKANSQGWFLWNERIAFLPSVASRRSPHSLCCLKDDDATYRYWKANKQWLCLVFVVFAII